MKNWLKRNRGFLVFLLGFAFLRTAIADWNPIPSGSMRPTLLEGDVVLVNRLAYDVKLPLTDIVLVKLDEPRYGDVVTFSSPINGTRLIKRLIALPGDVVEMRDERLTVNGQAADYGLEVVGAEPLAPEMTTPSLTETEHLGTSERTIRFLPEMTARRTFGPVVVPADSYFFLGDNRDNSADSRFIGPVRRELLIGHAHHVLVSADIEGGWWPRWGRVGKAIR